MKTRDHYLLLTVVQSVLLLHRSNSYFGGYRYFRANFTLDKSNDCKLKYLDPGSILSSKDVNESRTIGKNMENVLTKHRVEMDLHYPTEKLTTPLIAAIDRGDPRILRSLVDRYPVALDSTLTQPCGKTALMHASYVTRNIDILRVLVEKGTDTHKIDIRGWNCLYYAIVGERMGNVEYLLTLGVKLNSQDEQGRTPLMIAVLLSNFAVVKFLIDHGANPRLTDNSGYTAFRIAILRKKQEQAALLITRGSDVDCIPLTCTDSDYKLAEYLMPDLIPLNQ